MKAIRQQNWTRCVQGVLAAACVGLLPVGCNDDSDAPTRINVTGIWAMTTSGVNVSIEGGIHSTVTLTQSGDTVTGTAVSEFEERSTLEGTCDASGHLLLTETGNVVTYSWDLRWDAASGELRGTAMHNGDGRTFDIVMRRAD